MIDIDMARTGRGLTSLFHFDSIPGLWTQIVLAYFIHKSLIFIRVPLTAALLPKVVKSLRKWGWKVGRK